MRKILLIFSISWGVSALLLFLPFLLIGESYGMILNLLTFPFSRLSGDWPASMAVLFSGVMVTFCVSIPVTASAALVLSAKGHAEKCG